MLSASVQAQQSAIDRYFDKYQEDDRFTAITVSSRMFGMFADFDLEDPNEQEFAEILAKLEGMKMLVGEKMEEAPTAFKQAQFLVDKDMEQLMSMKDGNERFVFYVREKGERIAELLMLGYENQQFMMLSLVGDIKLSEIARLSRKMDIEGFQHFQNLE
jgi:hypothetical protein